MGQFAENLKKLPGVSHVAEIKAAARCARPGSRDDREQVWQPGITGGLNHLAQTYGAITPDAAEKVWRSLPSTPTTRAAIRANIPHRSSVGAP